MLSKNQIKFVRRLKQKKYRQQHGLFIAEGVKTITELLNSNFELYHLYTTESFNIDANLETMISFPELKKISALKSPNKALAVFVMPEQQSVDLNTLIVALDDVQDPGNLGTIIRLCDWFGVTHLVCSETTVDCFNPKVIQATMGSITRVNIVYSSLHDFLSDVDVDVFGAFMEGKPVYSQQLPEQGVLVMGNEGNGISDAVKQHITKKIAIPRFGDMQKTESLNVATATAILLSEFKRSTGT
ncbi:TrmH family RNA methyltransferase [Mangrovimonas spongiae]|uniref:RNA methyltransferase n=1 Tax=Mangrovimonas spongiae TaxID=2494697 RepID=A0A428K695_9FLAO|nr:RNA methyltransferase [Mangrovimonas spongiae]RSK41978.1 RNA methyltransferase [Mangrovimonas spongiae]